MTDDISHQDTIVWAAQTREGMVFVPIDGATTALIGDAALAVLADDVGRRRAARLIGLAAGAISDGDGTWRLIGLFRIAPEGSPLSTLVDDGGDKPREGHDWGALGLPDGLDSRVTPLDSRPLLGDVALARASAGKRHGDAVWWLTVAPGDCVLAEGTVATVIAVDRRKRTAEIECDGETATVGLDDLQPVEKA